jgi:hypothetical protein
MKRDAGRGVGGGASTVPHTQARANLEPLYFAARDGSRRRRYRRRAPIHPHRLPQRRGHQAQPPPASQYPLLASRRRPPLEAVCGEVGHVSSVDEQQGLQQFGFLGFSPAGGPVILHAAQSKNV